MHPKKIDLYQGKHEVIESAGLILCYEGFEPVAYDVASRLHGQRTGVEFASVIYIQVKRCNRPPVTLRFVAFSEESSLNMRDGDEDNSFVVCPIRFYGIAGEMINYELVNDPPFDEKITLSLVE